MQMFELEKNSNYRGSNSQGYLLGDLQGNWKFVFESAKVRELHEFELEKVDYISEHTSPHARQWWRRLYAVNRLQQIQHMVARASGTQLGAILPMSLVGLYEKIATLGYVMATDSRE